MKFPKISKRIVGGQVSESGEWPWLVSMQLRFENNTVTHMCGGSLISDLWVLSAAHCFEKSSAPFLSNNPRDWTVRIGEHFMFEDGDEQDEVEVSKIIFNHNRDCCSENRTTEYDIVLIKLARPVKLNEVVNVVCLPGYNEPLKPGTPCLAAGWGHMEEKGQISETVRHVLVHTIDNDLCSTWYTSLEKGFQELTDNMLCAGEEDGGKDACQYDSGGPLVHYNEQEDRWIVFGIVSNGYGCARSRYPGIYTRVSSFIPWIEKTVKFE
ncbi:hypothetical protein HELRODRAFT_157319 [Helobdella robusta]|uniref:Peptidase S1 domain-containing protein n=1 Tax=Helobdella robusta TaxID=6412 RepID=T1EM96_HELRO|nr:hypothetical protein HELRODRAFT_157319 [Helobdella robusta]ESO00958.1 hypothetical protein HELRODRAFT_157319 [Helobdella robusta]